MTTWQFHAAVKNYMNKRPEQRKGQAMYNVAWHYLGNKLDSIIGTDKDPFYNDKNINAFVAHLTDNNFFSDVD